jgi:UDPglucose--hexose-1-phosphate uridylyltransferase
MSLRWDPLLEEWIIVSGTRANRPMLPKKYCPFCPGSREVPNSEWTVLSLPNRFPALNPNAAYPIIKSEGIYRTRASKGVCEIILYTPKHDTTLAELSIANIKSVINLWSQRYKELSHKNYIKHIFIFENKGREIGVTLDHPHGQIYGFPFIPPLIQKELKNSRKFWKKTNCCLFCKIIEKEQKNKSRLIDENKDFICFIPFFAHWPYGVHIYPKRHIRNLLELENSEKESFALILKRILRRFDNLFNISFPYMMVLHQAPTNRKLYPYYHLHLEFYPPYREKNRIKYFASVETGSGTTTFDYTPELKAKELRDSSTD